MAITPLPVPVPQTSDPTNFNTRADAFMTALPTFGTEANALQVDVNNKQSLAAGSAAAALQSEINSAATSAAAIVAANAIPWVSGTTYSQGASLISQIDFKTYRRKSATGGGTTDPSLDLTNYVLISNGALQAIKVSQRLASGTSGGVASVNPVTVTRVFNTTDYNDIAGASLSGNTVILPAGTYEVDAVAPWAAATNQMLYLYNVTDSSVVLTGGSINSGEFSQLNGLVSGRFTIAAQKTFELRQYLRTNSSTNFPTYGGATSLAGFVETYAQLAITKIK